MKNNSFHISQIFKITSFIFNKGFIWIEIKQLFNDGLEEYLNDL